MLSVDVQKDFRAGRETVFRLAARFAAANGFTVLTGPSGAGKTSLLRMIAGIVRPDAGRIELAGETLFDAARGVDRPVQARRVGFVFQDYALFPHLSAAENVAYGVREKRRAARLARAAEMLALFRIEHLARRIPREMSGGEQQRVALARALASAPRIILLDEPLSAVDVETRARLLDEIENAQERARVPFIYVTHNPHEADRLGRRRIRLENGVVAEETANPE